MALMDYVMAVGKGALAIAGAVGVHKVLGIGGEYMDALVQGTEFATVYANDFIQGAGHVIKVAAPCLTAFSASRHLLKRNTVEKFVGGVLELGSAYMLTAGTLEALPGLSPEGNFRDANTVLTKNSGIVSLATGGVAAAVSLATKPASPKKTAASTP